MGQNKSIGGVRQWMAIVCMFLCAAVFPLDALASPSERFLESYEIGKGEMNVYCADLEEGKSVQAEQFAATLSSQELSVKKVRTAGEMKTPMTFYCLADVSGSMGQEQMEQEKAILSVICDGLGEQDNMVLGSLGNQVSATGFLSDKTKIHAAIDALQAGKEDTNLYAGIVSSMKTLTEDSNVRRKKCLLILSDGKDDQKGGITQKEAEQAVQNNAIPVYTVAVLPVSQTEEQIEQAKLLGSFARISTGGAHYAPAIDGMDAQKAGQNILQDMKNGIVLTFDISQVNNETGKDVFFLRVVHTAADKSVQEDTMEVLAEDFPDMGEAEGKTPAVIPEPEPEPGSERKQEPGSEPKTGGNGMLIAGFVIAVLIAIAGAAAAVIMKKREQIVPKKEDSTKKKNPMPYQKARNVRQESKKAPSKEPEKQGKDRHVKFTAIGYEEICYTLRMQEGRIVTVGRDKRAELMLNTEDKKLSGIHCRMQCEGDVLHVWDMDSTNGTFVNGVSVKKIGMATVGEGESIRLGSYEYRISFEKI